MSVATMLTRGVSVPNASHAVVAIEQGSYPVELAEPQSPVALCQVLIAVHDTPDHRRGATFAFVNSPFEA